VLKVVGDGGESNATGAATAGSSLLDEIVRDGARQMLAAALQAEVAAYIEAHVDQVDEKGRRLVVRNGFHIEREVTTAAGAVPVKQPRVNDKRIDEAPGRPASEWRSSSSNPPRHAGAPSTPLTSSPWSEPARGSRTDSSSNDPNQTTNLKPHDTPLRRSLSTPGIIAARRPAAAVYFGAIVALRVGITEALRPCSDSAA
jgi:hypothetical protein